MDLIVGDDQVKWSLTKNGIFSVKSLYRELTLNSIGYPHKFMWKAKIPLKIKIFLWLTLRKSILTKDNLLRRGWKGNSLCHFCGNLETVDHLFISCSTARMIWSILRCAFNFSKTPDSIQELFGTWLNSFSKEKRKMVLAGAAAILWTLWNARNAICFDNKKIHDPTIQIHMVIHWINSWSIL